MDIFQNHPSQTQNHFPWICPSLIYYWLFQNPAMSNNHLFPLSVQNRGVQLYYYFDVFTEGKLHDAEFNIKLFTNRLIH